jgi:hypothetical protein
MLLLRESVKVRDSAAGLRGVDSVCRNPLRLVRARTTTLSNPFRSDALVECVPSSHDGQRYQIGGLSLTISGAGQLLTLPDHRDSIRGTLTIRR